MIVYPLMHQPNMILSYGRPDTFLLFAPRSVDQSRNDQGRRQPVVGLYPISISGIAGNDGDRVARIQVPQTQSVPPLSLRLIRAEF